jgi:hypothetical protein
VKEVRLAVTLADSSAAARPEFSNLPRVQHAACTKARMAARMCAGRVGQDLTTRANSESLGAGAVSGEVSEESSGCKSLSDVTLGPDDSRLWI